MNKKDLIAELEKRSGHKSAGIFSMAIPALLGQTAGSRISQAFGDPDDLSTEQGRRDATSKDLKGRGAGLLAGILAGMYLNRTGKVKSFRLHGWG